MSSASRLKEVLLEGEAVEPAAIERAEGADIGMQSSLLVDGALGEEDLLIYLSFAYDIEPASLDDYARFSPYALDMLPKSVAREHRAVPFRNDHGELALWVVEPLDGDTLGSISKDLGVRLNQFIWPELRYLEAAARFFGDDLPDWVAEFCGREGVRHIDYDSTLGVGWGLDEARDFISHCFDRDTVLEVFLGYAGESFGPRLLVQIGKRGLKPFLAADWPELTSRYTRAGLRRIKAECNPEAPIISADRGFGSPSLVGVAGLLQELGAAPTGTVQSMGIRLGSRYALAVVGPMASEVRATSVAELADAVSDQLTRLIQLAKQRQLPPKGERIPALPERFRSASLERALGEQDSMASVIPALENVGAYTRQSLAPGEAELGSETIAGMPLAPEQSEAQHSAPDLDPPAETQTDTDSAAEGGLDFGGILDDAGEGEQRFGSPSTAAADSDVVQDRVFDPDEADDTVGKQTVFGMPAEAGMAAEMVPERLASEASDMSEGELAARAEAAASAELEPVSEPVVQAAPTTFGVMLSLDSEPSEADDPAEPATAASSSDNFGVAVTRRRGDQKLSSRTLMGGFDVADGEESEPEAATTGAQTMLGGFDASPPEPEPEPEPEPAKPDASRTLLGGFEVDPYEAPVVTDDDITRGPTRSADDNDNTAPPIAVSPEGTIEREATKPNPFVPQAMILRGGRRKPALSGSSPAVDESTPAAQPQQDQPASTADPDEEPPRDTIVDYPEPTEDGSRESHAAPDHLAGDSSAPELLDQAPAGPSASPDSTSPGIPIPVESEDDSSGQVDDAWFELADGASWQSDDDDDESGASASSAISDPEETNEDAKQNPASLASDEIPPTPAASHDRGPETIPPELLEQLIDEGAVPEEIETAVETLDARKAEIAFAAAETVAAAGPLVIDLLAARFPGRIFVDRYQYTADTLPPIGDHGPVLRALALLGAPAREVARNNIDHSSVEVRFYATFLLTATGADGMLDRVVDRLYDRNAQTRDIARRVIAEHRFSPGAKQVFDRLRSDVLSMDEQRVEIAASVLAQSQDRQAVPVLIDALGGGDARVHSILQSALETITLRKSTTQYEWRQWWFDAVEQPRSVWLIDALNSPSDRIRQIVATELAGVEGLNLNYHPDQPAKLRKRAQKDLSNWFAENPD